MNQAPFHTYRVFTHIAENLFGNTSSVVHLPEAIPEKLMQQLASDFWQPATTFLWTQDGQWNVRWFAPDAEIGLCGHGAMAAVAYLSDLERTDITIMAGEQPITGGIAKEQAFINLKAFNMTRELPVEPYLEEALGIPVIAHFETDNKNIVLTDHAKSVQQMKPDFSKLRTSPIFGYIVTAPGEDVDFVSRTLVPHVHQLEDPATGSSHAALAPFWSQRLGKKQLQSRQLSKRGGRFEIRMEDNFVKLLGHFEKVNEGNVFLT